MINPLKQSIKKLMNEPLSRDLIYTFMSFLILALSGVFINIIITVVREPSDLGVFNLSYAIYIISSQFATWGIQYSVLTYSAYYSDDEKTRNTLFYTASLITLLTGLFWTYLITTNKAFLLTCFKDEKTVQTIIYASFGLLLFPLNKVLINYINALQKMKAFALFQGLRYLAVMFFVSLVTLSSWSIIYTGWCFLFAESITALLSLSYLIKQKLIQRPDYSLYWLKTHLTFGTKSLFAGIFVELNSRLDVLLIGYFLTPFDVGIYSFVAMLADGVYHILGMVRINFNPRLVAILRDSTHEKALELRKITLHYITPIIFSLCLIILFCYYGYSHFLVTHKGLSLGIPSLIVLLSSLTLLSFLVPFDNLMIVSGHPIYQTLQQLSMVITNVVATIFLVPYLNIMGAALGTVIGNFMGIIFLLFFAQQLFGWQLISNTYREAH